MRLFALVVYSFGYAYLAFILWAAMYFAYDHVRPQQRTLFNKSAEPVQNPSVGD